MAPATRKSTTTGTNKADAAKKKSPAKRGGRKRKRQTPSPESSPAATSAKRQDAREEPEAKSPPISRSEFKEQMKMLVDGLAAGLASNNNASIAASAAATPKSGNNAGANAKLAKFARNNPTLWFVRVDAEFTAKGVTDDAVKRSTAIAAMDADVVQKLAAVHASYDDLKKDVIRVLAPTAQGAANAVLDETISFGDVPTTYLANIRAAFANSKSFEDDVLKALIIRRCPEAMKTSLKEKADDMTADQMATFADRTYASHAEAGNVAHVTTVEIDASPSDPPIIARQTINAAFQGRPPGRSRPPFTPRGNGGNRTPGRGGRRGGGNGNGGNAGGGNGGQNFGGFGGRDFGRVRCRWHHRYGAKAFKCEAPEFCPPITAKPQQQ